jgi:hypothetical protein
MEVKQFFRELKNVCDKQRCDRCVIEWFCGFNLPHIKDEDIDKVFQDANIRGGENENKAAVALLKEIMECVKSDKSTDTWLLINYARVNAVIAQSLPQA